MRVGRAAVLTRSVQKGRSKNRDNRDSNIREPQVEMASEESGYDNDIIDLNDINLQENTQRRITFRKIPFALWIVGGIILILSLYLFYHLTLGFLGTIFKGYREGHWWQYLVVVALFGLSFLFIYAGKVETVMFDKDENEFSRHKTNIF